MDCNPGPRSWRFLDLGAGKWNRQAAATYLDSREVWWQGWPRAQKDHGTLCISCHTVVPYAMARPALSHELSETGMSPAEKTMFDSVEKRVSMWSEMVPFYSDANNGPGKTAQAHSTEAVLNAVVLASYDSRQGHLRPITRKALRRGLGVAAWFRRRCRRLALAGLSSRPVGIEPIRLSGSGAARGSGRQRARRLCRRAGVQPHMQRLVDYLRRRYASQPLINQIYVLWASAKVPGLLSADERKTLIQKVQSLQQSDGGWKLASLTQWKRIDDSLEPTESDGLATALAVLAMEESGSETRDESLNRGVAWLEQHQQKDGDWRSASPNKLRDPESNIGRFMSDAATGYAVLALENAR